VDSSVYLENTCKSTSKGKRKLGNIDEYGWMGNSRREKTDHVADIEK
jgi:hypothetical protein